MIRFILAISGSTTLTTNRLFPFWFGSVLRAWCVRWLISFVGSDRIWVGSLEACISCKRTLVLAELLSKTSVYDVKAEVAGQRLTASEQKVRHGCRILGHFFVPQKLSSGVQGQNKLTQHNQTYLT